MKIFVIIGLFFFLTSNESKGFSINQFRIKKIEFKNKHKHLTKLSTGDSVRHIEHGDLISIYDRKVQCNAKRDFKNSLSFDCVPNYRAIEEIKMPCVYKDKIYLHNDLIPVSAGVWIYFRGEVIPLRPGEMLICQDGTLKSVEIPMQR